MKRHWLLVIVFFLAAGAQAAESDSAVPPPISADQFPVYIEEAREIFRSGKVRDGLQKLNEILRADSLHAEALYLKGECCLIYGSPVVLDMISRLYDVGDSVHADFLNLKLMMFLGDGRFPKELERCRSRYPDSPEVRLAGWMWEMDRSGIPPDTAELMAIAADVVMGGLPYQAAFSVAADRSDREGLAYLELFLPYAASYYDQLKQKLEARVAMNPQVHLTGALELEYVQCGPEMGVYLVDSNGKKIKMALDTGTGSRLFTIHDQAVGDSLNGDTVLVLEDGIQFGYMDEPADIVTKPVDFSIPEVTNVAVEYFDGRFTLADGCFSPLAFRGVAMTVDPVNERVVVRDREAYRAWRDSLIEGTYADVPLILRDGWPYIPCNVNGHEVLMMLETGSRDVNFNEIAVRWYDLPAYDSVLIWREKEYPTEMLDVTINVGGLEYEVTGGLVTERIVGYHHYGMGAAGDIGPEFMRNFIWTLDPWDRRLILIRPAAS